MYEFKLTPAYCLFNGIAILEQHGAEIMFIVENLEDVVLQGRLRRAFVEYLEGLAELKDIPEFFKREAKIDFIEGSREQIRRCVSGLYKAENETEQAAVAVIEQKQKEAAAILLLDSILHDACKKGATDIHIEKNIIRFRISGALEKQIELQLERCEELIQRIKLLAGMNVIEKRKSQDGRFVYGTAKPIFIRVSDVIVIGEKQETYEALVLRLLDTSRIPLNLNLLGFNEEQLLKITEFEEFKNGLVLVCGATGSGKSTTIAAMLVDLELKTNGTLKIISMEDPPEYVIPGVSQIQINEEYGNSYDEALTHIFRQDPDVIMIGEIRDEKTAAVAVRAALTGHLVFATLHTCGPGEAVLRLENLGVQRNLLASVLRGIICQELNFIDKKSNLCADVSLPKKNFAASLKEYFTEEELDERFEHCTNYSEVLSKTLLRFGKFDSTKTLKRDWSGGVFGQNIHKQIG